MAGDAPVPAVLRILIGDHLGQVKAVQGPAGGGAALDAAAPVAAWGAPDAAAAVEALAVWPPSPWDAGGGGDGAAAPDAQQQQQQRAVVVAVGRASGAVELLDAATGARLAALAASDAAAGFEGAAVRGVHLLPPPDGALPGGLPRVLSVTRGGAARLHAPPRPGGGGAWAVAAAWATPPDVACTALHARAGLLAVGCRGAELRVYDAGTGAPVYAAKGGKPDPRTRLADKPWNTAVAFIEAPADSAAGGATVVVGTGAGKVRVYATAAGKRPQLDLPFRDARVTALAPEPGGARVWVADGKGRVEALDVRARRFGGGCRGAAGSVRALALHPRLPLLAAAGLDRYVRLHSTATRALLGKAYLKTQANAVAFGPPPPPAAAAAAAARPSEAEKKTAKRAADGDAARQERGGAKAQRR